MKWEKMPGKYVIDSNIFIKILLEEKDSPLAKDFFVHCLKREIQLLVPSLFPYEVLYIAQKYGHDTQAVSDHLKKHKQLQVVELSTALIDKTIQIVEQSSQPKSGFPSFYDSCYHALAILNDCDFITADKKHYEKTKKLGNIQLLSDMKSIIVIG